MRRDDFEDVFPPDPQEPKAPHPVAAVILASMLLVASAWGLMEHAAAEKEKARLRMLAEAYAHEAAVSGGLLMDAAKAKEAAPALRVKVVVPNRGPLDLDKLRAAGATGVVHCYTGGDLVAP